MCEFMTGLGRPDGDKCLHCGIYKDVIRSVHPDFFHPKFGQEGKPNYSQYQLIIAENFNWVVYNKPWSWHADMRELYFVMIRNGSVYSSPYPCLYDESHEIKEDYCGCIYCSSEDCVSDGVIVFCKKCSLEIQQVMSDGPEIKSETNVSHLN